MYLTASQRDDGGFPQNFLARRATVLVGSQLDEVAFPIMLPGGCVVNKRSATSTRLRWCWVPPRSLSVKAL